MAQKERIYNLHEILAELRQSHGLPKQLSTEAQLWDEILKKETFLMPEQLFPLITEIYQKSYPKGTSIKPLGTEYSVERSDTKEITSIRADVTILVDSHDIYHFECEIKNDKAMVIRMFEYDAHISLSYQDDPLTLKFPRSAVLYLQDNKCIPNELSCTLQFPFGGVFRYKVPTIKVQTYSLEEIKKRHLCILIPFLPLRFRKHLRSKNNRKNFNTEELTSFYQELILILNEEVNNKYLSENHRNIIINLLNKSLIRVFYSDEYLLKEVVAMTEPILELEIEKYIYALDAKTDEISRLINEFDQVSQELSRKRDAFDQVSQELSRKRDAFDQVSQELSRKRDAFDQVSQELSRKRDAFDQVSQELSRKNEVLIQKDAEIALLKKKLQELQ